MLVLVAGVLGTHSEERIICGAAAGTGKFPYQVSLRHDLGRRHFCGRSIIASRFILTAAQCTQGQFANPRFVRVAYGGNRISYGPRIIDLDRIVSHPKYDRYTGANDIAVLRIWFNRLLCQRPMYQLRATFRPSSVAGDNLVWVLVFRINTIWIFLVQISMNHVQHGLVTNPATFPDALQFMNTTTLSRTECVRRLEENGGRVDVNAVCSINRAGIGACALCRWLRWTIGNPWNAKSIDRCYELGNRMCSRLSRCLRTCFPTLGIHSKHHASLGWI